MLIDDSKLQAQLDRIEAKIDAFSAPSKWRTIYADNFNTYALGDLPSAWQIGIPWVGANQPGATTKIVSKLAGRMLECGLDNAYHNQQGARAFFVPNQGRWDYFTGLENKLVRVRYSQYFPTPIVCEAGAQLWTTAGLELKDHDGPAAVAPDVVSDAMGSFFTLQHWTEQARQAKPVYIPWQLWFDVTFEIYFSRTDGRSKFTTSFGSKIESAGQNMSSDTAGVGPALCLYGNNIVGGKATCQFRDFAVDVAA